VHLAVKLLFVIALSLACAMESFWAIRVSVLMLLIESVFGIRADIASMTANVADQKTFSMSNIQAQQPAQEEQKASSGDVDNPETKDPQPKTSYKKLAENPIIARQRQEAKDRQNQAPTLAEIRQRDRKLKNSEPKASYKKMAENPIIASQRKEAKDRASQRKEAKDRQATPITLTDIREREKKRAEESNTASP
jgi:hypothetical protein